jgi:hypothetical protein
MIIENGTIELKQKATAAGIDPETGYPVKPEAATWGDPIPCQYYANKYSNLGRVNGEHFTTAEYTVLIELQPFDAEQIRLKDRQGNEVGEFSVIQTEPLEAVCELRILV